MKTKEEMETISDFIDNSAIVLVGVLCKRIEILQEQKVLSPNLFKALVKEHIYENARRLKELLYVHFVVGATKFKERPKISSKEE